MMNYERQAITSTARLPRHPGPHARAVACQGRQGTCGKTLGVVDGAVIFVRHNGREATYSLPCEVRCERCGQRTTVEARAA